MPLLLTFCPWRVLPWGSWEVKVGKLPGAGFLAEGGTTPDRPPLPPGGGVPPKNLNETSANRPKSPKQV